MLHEVHNSGGFNGPRGADSILITISKVFLLIKERIELHVDLRECGRAPVCERVTKKADSAFVAKVSVIWAW